MMAVLIKNSEDLKDEIARLKGLEQQQASQLKQHFSSPGAILSTVMSLFSSSKDDSKEEKNTSLFDQDFIGLLSRIVIPIALNKTLFKHSGFLVKALVGILSQKASHYINEDSVGGVWDKIKSAFKENVAHNPTVTGILDKIRGIFGGGSKPASRSRGRIKNAPVPEYVQAS
jgi:hypothetical protein